jgi:hypothetical protein
MKTKEAIAESLKPQVHERFFASLRMTDRGWVGIEDGAKTANDATEECVTPSAGAGL